MKFEWKCLDSKDTGYTQRAKIYGGWLIRTFDNEDSSMAMVFIPDPDHEWTIED